jgi:acyl-coenzyme A synthetase/AMP-(fatty) acid ligase
VVGYPHDIKGQGIYAYVTLMQGEEPSDALRKEWPETLMTSSTRPVIQ